MKAVCLPGSYVHQACVPTRSYAITNTTEYQTISPTRQLTLQGGESTQGTREGPPPRVAGSHTWLRRGGWASTRQHEE